MSPVAFIPLFILAAAVILFYIIRHIRLKKSRLRELASDLGREDLKSGKTYEGEQDGHKFYYEYYAGSKNRPSSFRIWLDSPSQGGFKIGRERVLDTFFKRLGIAVEIQTGDAEFDGLFYIRTDHVAFTRSFLYVPETRESMKVVHRLGFTELSHDGKSIEAKISPFNLPKMNTSLNTDAVLGELVELARRMPADSVEKSYTGMPGWKLRRNAVYTINTVVVAGGVGLLVWGLASYTPLRAFDIFIWSTEFSIPALLLFMVAMVYLLKGRSSSHTDLLINFGMAAIGLPLACFGGAMSLNGYLDVSEIRYYDTKVIGKRYSTSRNSTNYYASLESWNPDRQREEVRINQSIYRKINAGGTIMTIATRPGRLGFEWIVGYRIKKQLEVKEPPERHHSRALPAFTEPGRRAGN